MTKRRSMVLPCVAGVTLSLAISLPAEAGGWGHGPSLHQIAHSWGRGPSWQQARKDGGNVAKAVHKAFSSVTVGGGGIGGGGSGERMNGENSDGTVHQDTDSGRLTKDLLLPLIPKNWTPRPSGPVLENAKSPVVPPSCGMNCEGPAETNPAMDLPEKPIEPPEIVD